MRAARLGRDSFFFLARLTADHSFLPPLIKFSLCFSPKQELFPLFQSQQLAAAAKAVQYRDGKSFLIFSSGKSRKEKKRERERWTVSAASLMRQLLLKAKMAGGRVDEG